MKKMLLGVLTLPFLAGPLVANATLIYTFQFDALEDGYLGLGYAAAEISFTTSSFATSPGDTLTYLSGDVNGCSPATLTLNGGFNAFVTPVFGFGSCGDVGGSAVDGLFFRSDIMPPLTTGVFVSSGTAGRQFDDGSGGNSYFYTSGVLTIIDDVVSVPEPATLSLLGAGLFGMVLARRRRRGDRSGQRV